MLVDDTYTQNLYLHLDREQPSMKYMIRPFMFVQCTYMLHTNFDIDVICFQLGNGQFQLLMQFCNLFYIRTTTYFLRLLLFFKTWNFPQLTIEKGMLYVQYTHHILDNTNNWGWTNLRGAWKIQMKNTLHAFCLTRIRKDCWRRKGSFPSICQLLF